MNLEDMKFFFDDEIHIDSFSSLDSFCLEFIVLCKLKCGNINLKHEDSQLKLYYYRVPEENTTNSMVVSEKKDLCLDSSDYQKDISFFMNQYQAFFSGEISVYLNAKRRLTQIIIDGPTRSFSNVEVNIILAVLPRLFPWYFSELPKELKIKMAELLNGERGFFRNELDLEIKNRGMKQKILLAQAAQMSQKLLGVQLNKVRADINENNRRINNLMSQITVESKSLRENIAKREALTVNADNSQKPIMDLIDFIENSNENITIDSIVNTTLLLSIRTEMSIWQDEEYRAYVIDNRGDSYFFRTMPCSIEEIRMLCKAIFEQRKIKVFFNLGISINLEDGELGPNYSQSEEIANSMPHPHLNSGIFCMGNNVEHIAQYLKTFQLVEMLNCILYSAKQFTIADSYIGEIFLKNLTEFQALQMPNGEFMNYEEAIKYMNEHEEEFND